MDPKGEGVSSAVNPYEGTTLRGKPDSLTDPQSPQQQQHGEDSSKPGPSCVSMKSDVSKDIIINFHKTEEISEADSIQSSQELPENLDSVFSGIEENIVTFVRNELKKHQKFLTSELQSFEMQREEDEEVYGCSREAFLTILVQFLKIMKKEGLANCLESRSLAAACQRELKSSLKKKFQCLFEGPAKTETPLNQIYTELYITEGGGGKVRQIETSSRSTIKTETELRCEDIFKRSSGRDKPVKTVMTKGVAGIGKTVITQKFTLDWAEDKANRDMQFVFPFTFRELNVLGNKKYSLVKLLHDHFNETKEAGICRFEHFKVVFIFDGLDECRLPLDFENNEMLTDPTELTSVDVLLTNLFRGNLFPSAHIWITTRPAAAGQIPSEWIDMVTEVKGFTESQREEYFRKRFPNQEQAGRIVSHIKTSQSLSIMCHIPVFCWITAAVLEGALKTGQGVVLPKTLTEMYIHLLVVQCKMKNIKYHGGAETDTPWNPDTKKMILSLGKLAFEQLQKGKVIFYESDLTESCIDVRAASVFSGVFTQMFKEESGLYQGKVFFFVHLSVQEFLAALYVHLTFINSGVNLLSEDQLIFEAYKTVKAESLEAYFYQNAVDKALQCPNGHLDLFLRFLLGLLQETNQTLLEGLQTQTRSSSQIKQGTVKYIKRQIEDNPSTERNISLFHCLNELNDHSLVEEIQGFLNSGRISSGDLSPAQWSALVFILLTSEKRQDVFDLSKYCASERALLRLLPVIKASKKALLSDCNLSEESCEALSSVLSSQSSRLRDLDLSNNDLRDSGVNLLSAGLQSLQCKLEILRLSGCLITEEGCASLASALSSNPSHLREIDLSYNHPGERGERLLSAGLKDPHWKLNTLRFEPRGAQWLRPGLRKYYCELTLDPTTANRNLILSDNNRKVTWVLNEQAYSDHTERFDYCCQLLCANQLSGRCYWEVEWEGETLISVSYSSIRRKEGADSRFGGNEQSWSLCCSAGGYSVWHNNKEIVLPFSFSSYSNRVSVYMDYTAGTLSFYRVSPNTLSHLYTFRCTFTEPLYPGFGFLFGFRVCPGFSVSLCSV
ncbi:NACHT, LRR and PYD domains-containing protein 12-like isoform X3 [Toxotes jaculatrix]|uniref:NACHT, LRR and PYD domains-containing protein 12-like isoform X3 n=1 Tax=Toxotes jaculatrix TaxID=941984 RepID=UPI001B3AFD5F|nr:NACHT, LRR and PYD domains-containing protein 12-like isoform X3 [Toxotes jaculatrix]